MCKYKSKFQFLFSTTEAAGDEMMTQDASAAAPQNTLDNNKLRKMVSTLPDLPNQSNWRSSARDAGVQDECTRQSRPRRRSSLPKRQLSRTDSTMVEMTTEAVAPIVHRRSSDLPDVSDVASRNNQDVETGHFVACRRRGSGSVKKKLTRTDSKVMVVTSDPANLALRIEAPSFDEQQDALCDSLLEDLEEPGLMLPSKRDFGSKSPPILVSEHSDPHMLLHNGKRNPERQPTLPNSTSCPNLLKTAVDPNDIEMSRHQLRYSRSSDSKIFEERPLHRSGSPNLLKVPDVFTTSFHISRSMDQMSTSSSKKVHRNSAPELSEISTAFPAEGNENSTPDRTSLVKSFSDNPPSERKSPLQTLSDSRIKMFQSVQHPIRTEPKPFTPIIGHVAEGVFMGNVESTFAERLLCKHNIGSVVDVSGCPPDTLPAHKRSDVPCVCGHESRHLRSCLRLCLAEATPSEMRELLHKTNRFIEGARAKERGVLVCCYYGNQWSALVVMFYLMTKMGMNLRKAYSMVMLNRSDIELSNDIKRFLQLTEKSHFGPCEQSLCIEADHTDKNALLPREAWVDKPTAN